MDVYVCVCVYISFAKADCLESDCTEGGRGSDLLLALLLRVGPGPPFVSLAITACFVLSGRVRVCVCLRHARKIVLYTCIFTTCICTTTTTTISSRICSDDGALTLTLMKHPDRSWRYAIPVC